MEFWDNIHWIWLE